MSSPLRIMLRAPSLHEDMRCDMEDIEDIQSNIGT